MHPRDKGLCAMNLVCAFRTLFCAACLGFPLTSAATEFPPEANLLSQELVTHLQAKGLLLADADLEDPRLEAADIDPLPGSHMPPGERKAWLAQLAELRKATFDQRALYGFTAERLAELKPRTRSWVEQEFPRHEEESRAYQAKLEVLRAADPRFDLRFAASLQVAREQIVRIPRNAGVLPAPRCTDPREYQRAFQRLVNARHHEIFHRRWGVELPYPPAPPAVTHWDIEEWEGFALQRGTEASEAPAPR